MKYPPPHPARKLRAQLVLKVHRPRRPLPKGRGYHASIATQQRGARNKDYRKNNSEAQVNKEYVREGDYLAIVDMKMIDSGRELVPHIPMLVPSDEAKAAIENVRIALRNGDLASAAKLARVYELKPIAAE